MIIKSRDIILTLLFFTTAFWIAAFYKDYKGDEFYSWVYAKKCTYVEILQLKDTGIGHPPLYHLLQKISQDILPNKPPINVRTVNFIAGVLFLFFLIKFLSRHKLNLFFFYSLMDYRI